MSALPNMPEPTDFSKQAPFRLNEGFAQQEQPQEAPDVLGDDELLRASAMDARGSRQIAPFATYEAVDAAIEDGYYTGLEALDFGTLADGTPAAMFTDKNGVRQAVRMSEEKWFAAMQQRAQGRIALAQQMRTKRDADRLRPSIAKMAKELEAYAPGLAQYAEIGLERDPGRAYAEMQDYYSKIKAQDMAALQELQFKIAKTNEEMTQAIADNWATKTNEEYQMMQEGFLNDSSIPEEVRTQRALEMRRWQKNVERFAYLIPPADQIRQNYSFVQWFVGQDPAALTDLADMTMQTFGEHNLKGYPEQMRLPVLVQKAQELARNLNWTRPFSQTDVQQVAAVIQQRMYGGISAAPVMRIAQPEEVSQLSPYSQAMLRGAQGQIARGEEAAQYERRLREAKLESERTRAERTTAEAGRAAAGAERTRAETDIMRSIGRGGAPEAAAAPQAAAPSINESRVRSALAAAGVEIPDSGNLPEDIMVAAQQLRAAGPQGRSRLMELQRVLGTFRQTGQ